jgi:class 3 adenylate cyclase/putative methionine-R-sulfoxide reductase with GAF domain
MTGRTRTDSKAGKVQRQKAKSRQKGPSASTAALSNEPHDQAGELAESRKQLAEALEQQTATSEVLRIIAASSGDLEPVFDAMLRNATQICSAEFASLFRFENGTPQRLASLNVPSALTEFLRRGIPHVTPQNAFRRMIASRQQLHIDDYRADQAYIDRDPMAVAGVELGGIRSLLIVPMIKDDEVIGAFGIFRQEVRPFSQRQIQLVSNFAAQAVIAIENARLLNELRESLRQKTASADVLRIISASPGKLEPVFDAILENATQLCDAKFGLMYTYDGDKFHNAAIRDAPPALVEHHFRRGAFQPPPGTPLDRLLKTQAVVSTDDDRVEAIPSAPTRLAGARSHMAVPMLKDGALAGAIVIYRTEVNPFTETQIEVVKNFASQALIAIENARLLGELTQLNQQLEDRVAQQVGEIERMARLRRFLPPQVADLIVASGTEKQLESHRGDITALFCDLRGFTGFSESADPEDVMALLRAYHETIGAIIVKYNGTLERYAGDGVMVIFNDPVPVPDPALQAVKAALDIRASLGALIEKWRRLGHDLGFGIGISHGFATLGTIGFEGRFDYAAIGTVSNVASRLCDEAKPGQILISPRVLLAVEDFVAVEAVGEFDLKGIRRPMSAYDVVAAKSAD